MFVKAVKALYFTYRSAGALVFLDCRFYKYITPLGFRKWHFALKTLYVSLKLIHMGVSWVSPENCSFPKRYSCHKCFIVIHKTHSIHQIYDIIIYHKLLLRQTLPLFFRYTAERDKKTSYYSVEGHCL